MTKTYNLKNDTAGFKGDGIDFCGGTLYRHFPHLERLKRLRLTISTKRQHRKGEFKVEIDRSFYAPYVRFRGNTEEVFVSVLETVRQSFPNRDTFFVRFTPA